ncbi:nuclear transcription factor Y subunit B-1-like [Impatiens glandulifera]|uniref:nuclear transcription factor Y subunit B-1-like n=1 Tax=Impatiens glandulifera TaxID=253017 RepID=UPI001FB186B9|nr:nuclear transcription factor Y subunit B-1-like [Impatiens glandulifera]
MENKGSSLRVSTAPQTEPFIPVANVVRIMRRVVPPHGKIADNVKDIVQNCVSKFIGLINAKANMCCQSESRRTITADDILRAMASLGFDDYVSTLSFYLLRYRETESLGIAVSRRPVMTFGPIPDPMGHLVLQAHDVVGSHGPSRSSDPNAGPESRPSYDPFGRS